MKTTVFLAGALLLLANHSLRAADTDPKAIAFFESKIRPALIQHCYECHSVEAQQKKKLKGGLLLDTKAAVLKGGDTGPAVVPGKPAESLLIQALRYQSIQMPPKAKLPDNVVADFVKWVEMGAPDPREGTTTVQAKRTIDIETGKQYWAFKPIGNVTPPAVQNAAWAKTPIDRFILAKLEEKGLKPAAAADARVLVRRIYFDLTGLPPTAEQVNAFEKSAIRNPQSAIEELVDQLLESPRYGERWARHWLDVVRFAESGGYEFDRDRPGAFHYRDWVIKALNQDMGYDQFIRLQLAGDQLQPGDFAAATATGFVVAGPYPGQTTAKTLQIIRHDHLDDMLSTVGTSMLGLSLGCVRCHEHKFDPIPQMDYYRLLSAFGRTDSVEPKMDPQPEIYQKAKAEFDQKHAPLAAARDKFEKEELPGRLGKLLETEKAKPAPSWLILDSSGVHGKAKANFKKESDGSLVVPGKAEKTDVYSITAQTQQKGITAIRLEALADASLPKSGPGRGPDGNFVLTEITLTATPLGQAKAKATPVKLRAAATTFEQDKHPIAAALDGDSKSGWAIGGETGKNHAAVFETEGEIGFDGGTGLTITLKFEGDGYAIGRPRLSISTAPRPAKLDGPAVPQSAREALTLLEASQGQLNAKNREQVLRWYRPLDSQANQVYDAEEQHARQAPQPRVMPVFIAGQRGGGDVYFLVRGEVERKQGVVKPGYIQVLMRSPEQDQRWTHKGTTPVEPRVALANWITDTEHGGGQLLARVIVNRLWQHHLGRGIVATPNDFGVQGERPTHPELLDWLAAELIKNGWKLKPIHKLIVTSAVYHQSGEVNAAAVQIDPQNKLWCRRPARRLEAEAIRDSLLSVSASLDLTMHGPGTLNGESPRRSVYLTVKRSQLIPLLQMFDAPEAIQSIGVRPTTTVATQALAMMNSPFVRQQADKLAQRIKPKTPTELPQAVEAAYLTALARKPASTERDRMVVFIQGQVASYGQNPKALDLALGDFCQVLLCLNEFVYVD